MVGLLASTVIFMAYMGIKQGVLQGPLLFPLPCIVLLAWRYIHRKFSGAAAAAGVSSDATAATGSTDGVTKQQLQEARRSNTTTFSAEYLLPPAVNKLATVMPYPHRLTKPIVAIAAGSSAASAPKHMAEEDGAPQTNTSTRCLRDDGIGRVVPLLSRAGVLSESYLPYSDDSSILAVLRPGTMLAAAAAQTTGVAASTDSAPTVAAVAGTPYVVPRVSPLPPAASQVSIEQQQGQQQGYQPPVH